MALLRLRWFLQLELPVLLQVCGSLRHNQPITLPMQMPVSYTHLTLPTTPYV